MTENTIIENLISEVNREISGCSEKISKGETPEFEVLDTKIVQFSNTIAELGDAEKKTYSDLLKLWEEQIRVISNTLATQKDEIASKLDQVQGNKQATNSYNNVSKL